MSSTFRYKALGLAVVSALSVTSAHSAGLDRSGQDITAFLQDGTYAELVYTYVDANVSGSDNGVVGGADINYTKGKKVGDSAESYNFFRLGVKADASDRISVGVLYDEPFGAAVQYKADNNFVSAGGDATVKALLGSQGFDSFDKAQSFAEAVADLSIPYYTGVVNDLSAKVAAGNADKKEIEELKTAKATLGQANRLVAATSVAVTSEAQKGQGTDVKIGTRNTSVLAGVKLGKNRNFQIYGGPAAQHLTGQVHLRGIAYQGAQGYDARISPDTAVGWVAGVAYAKPEIALKAALTYRSKIDHDTMIAEKFPALGDKGVTSRDFSVTLPESYNLDFQTGVNPTTLLTAKVRYVPWSDVDIRPPTYGDATARTNNGIALPIVSYSDDQWSAEVGLGKRVTDRLAVSGAIGWDSGAGNPASTLGPIEGYYSVGLGAKYNITPAWSVALGGKYLKFGDATAHLPTGMTAGKFVDNDGFIAGVKLAYQAK